MSLILGYLLACLITFSDCDMYVAMNPRNRSFSSRASWIIWSCCLICPGTLAFEVWPCGLSSSLGVT